MVETRFRPECLTSKSGYLTVTCTASQQETARKIFHRHSLNCDDFHPAFFGGRCSWDRMMAVAFEVRKRKEIFIEKGKEYLFYIYNRIIISLQKNLNDKTYREYIK